MLQSMGLLRVGHDSVTERQLTPSTQSPGALLIAGNSFTFLQKENKKEGNKDAVV